MAKNKQVKQVVYAVAASFDEADRGLSVFSDINELVNEIGPVNGDSIAVFELVGFKTLKRNHLE